MSPGGELQVRLKMRDGAIASVSIASSRAPLPRRLFEGRAPDEVARIVPSLFSICRSAQSAAAAGALEAATRGPAIESTLAARRDAVRRESIIEMLTRLLIDWPRTMQVEPEVAAVARVRRSDDGSLAACRAAAQEHVFGADAPRWLASTTLTVLSDWLERGATLPARLLARLQAESPDLGRSDVAAMPAATPEALAAAVLPRLAADASFGLRPDWLGRPVETGSLARVGAHPLVAAFVAENGNSAAARYLARIVELALLLSSAPGADQLPPAARQHAPRTGVGVGLAETSRGLLLHMARVESDRVTDYAIVAPTEWNFHPQGALVKGLVARARRAADALCDARVLAQALDPCLECDFEVEHA